MKNDLCLLDTCVLLHLILGKEIGKKIDRAYSLQKLANKPLICVVTHGELRSMAHRRAWGEPKIIALEKALSEVVTVDIGHDAVIDAYAKLEEYAQSRPKGAKIWVRTTCG